LPGAAANVRAAAERAAEAECAAAERGAAERGTVELAAEAELCAGDGVEGPVPAVVHEQSAGVESLRHVFTMSSVSFSKRSASESIAAEGHVRMTRQVFQEVTLIEKVTVVDEHTWLWREGHRLAEESMLDLCRGGKFMDLIVQSA